MNQKEKKRFVRELIGNIQSDLLARIHRVPDEWDGHELRQWIADKFQESSFTLQRDRKRYREYKNTVLVNNLD